MKSNYYVFTYEDDYKSYWETDSTFGEVFHAVGMANKSFNCKHGKITTVRKLSQSQFYEMAFKP